MGAIEPILVATSRTASEGARFRAGALEGARLRALRGVGAAGPGAGDVSFPQSLPGDPRTDFLTVDAAAHPRRAGLPAPVDADLALRPPGERRLFVFVHGFNTNFAEGIYRQAQMLHDFGTPALGVHYAWPSAADARLYLYDRDSAFFARDGLEQLLRLLGDSDAERIVLVGHSMGAQVTLEALRQMALVGAPRLLRQARRGGAALARRGRRPFPQRGGAAPRWTSRGSSSSPATTGRSGRVVPRGRQARLGSIVDPAALAGLDVTVIDMSGVAGGDRSNHSVVASSPVMISLVQGLARYGRRSWRGHAPTSAWPRPPPTWCRA